MKIRFREFLELATIAGMAAIVLGLGSWLDDNWRPWLLGLVVVFSLTKTVYFIFEILWHLHQAIAADLAYHRFVMLIAYNMAEVTFSFAVDYFCLLSIDAESLSGVDPVLSGGLLLFECFYFSVLNFSYFGYGEIMPANVAAKIIVLTEIVTAFSTVIFLLSDFISMKESIRRSRNINGG